MPRWTAEDAATTTELSSSVASSLDETFAVSVISGPDEGRRVIVAPSLPARVLMGTSPACDIVLTDRMVSRRHAALELSRSRLRVTDLGSTNGTYVQGLLVGDAYLRGGEMIRLGETVLRVEALGAIPVPELPNAARFGKLVGASEEMRRLYPLCDRLAASAVPVIIEGETGTGKEVLAEALHEQGPRAAKPFVVFDCTAVPPTLVESALFGHERGAFTGASETRRGVFEEAHGGTLLLDEIGDLELALQAKLLRAIQRSEIQRVGSAKWIKVDIRVLAATRRDLEREIQAGRFRDDLFFRLAVARIELPPLRRRRGDVTVLAHHFWQELAGRTTPFPEGFAARLEDYDWPGNVRELYNAVARRVALGEAAPIETTRSAVGGPPSGRTPGHSQPPPSSLGGGGGAWPSGPESGSTADVVEETLALDLPLARARERVVEEFERRYVQRVLAQHGGNVRNAAAASGIARRYFQILRARRVPGGDP
ncbi:sigma 54-interacting transcriptional regulator [Chondromyces crocatus]|uniref:ATPase AAA n=1 Tax=Chondromyces crocatus TaxID=52 RepID=A0A0K1EC37_CHOCO|nr:sigma 54-interacting transcriptional regulator [Chondromyces crocatus]AKT38123.1 ATPase AAA [Chondromyces crocatus]